MAVDIDRTRPLGAIVVGRAGMDLYPLPDGTEIEAAATFGAEIGGSAGNIAVALARQGIRAALLSPLSDDPVGRFVRATLDRYDVDTSRCRAVAGDYRTSLALAETRPSDCDVVIYRNGAADLQLTEDDIDPAFVARASVMIVTGTALATEPSRSGAVAALAAARAAKTFSILDIDHRQYSWRSTEEASRAYSEAGRQCNAVVGNDAEFALIAGSRGRALEAAAAFVKGGSDFAVYKKGVEGALTITPDGSFETGIFPVDMKKPFGAGDAFLGGLVAGLLGGHPLTTSVMRGAATAAHVVARRGCAFAMPTSAEVEMLLARPAIEATG